MAVKKREKRYMTGHEKRLRKMMIDHQVSLSEIAEYEEVSEPAISLRLKSLTPSIVQRFEDIILELSKQRTPEKVAS